MGGSNDQSQEQKTNQLGLETAELSGDSDLIQSTGSVSINQNVPDEIVNIIGDLSGASERNAQQTIDLSKNVLDTAGGLISQLVSQRVGENDSSLTPAASNNFQSATNTINQAVPWVAGAAVLYLITKGK